MAAKKRRGRIRYTVDQHVKLLKQEQALEQQLSAIAVKLAALRSELSKFNRAAVRLAVKNGGGSDRVVHAE